MAEYIKRADALEAIRKWCGDCGSAIEAVLSVPAARGWDPDGVTNLHGTQATMGNVEMVPNDECGVLSGG